MWQSRATRGYEELSKAIGRRRARILARTQTVECGGREDLRFLSLSQNFGVWRYTGQSMCVWHAPTLIGGMSVRTLNCSWSPPLANSDWPVRRG